MLLHGLFMGTNYEGSPYELAGCVNDVNDWARLIGVHCNRMRCLVGAQARRSAMVESLRDMVSRLKSGDWGIITWSGHGTWRPDKSGDEPDGHDECLVSDDDKILPDDWLYKILVERAKGSRIFLLTDSCHNGTMYRASFVRRAMHSARSAFSSRRIRFVDPYRWFKDDPEFHQRAQQMARGALPKKQQMVPMMVHMAGCQDHEYSYDATFHGRPNGAFSRVAMDTLVVLCKQPGRHMFLDWHRLIRKRLPSKAYPQTPTCTLREGMRGHVLPWE